MANKTEAHSLTHLQLLVLANLSSSKGANEDELAATIAKLAPPEGSRSPRDYVIEALAELRKQSLATNSTSRKPGRSRATEDGHRALCVRLGLQTKPRWDTFQKRHIPALGLKIPLVSPQVEKLGQAEELMLAVLKRHLAADSSKVPGVADARTIDALCAALVAKDSKGETANGKISLRQMLGRSWAYQVVTPSSTISRSTVEAADSPAAPRVKSSDNGDRSTARGSSQLSIPTSETSNIPRSDRTSSLAISADTLLNLVREAIPRIGSDGRFGPEKVFVSALWHYIEEDGRLPDLSLDRFKTWLVTANRDQMVDLVRADSQGDMDSQLLEESEINDRGSTFHFVIDRKIAAASSRGIHAR